MKVYFVTLDAEGLPTYPVKIGVANNIDKRISDLQTGCPWPLRLIAKLNCKSRKAAYSLERQFHRNYSHKRIQGEWFWFSNEHAFAHTLTRLSTPISYLPLPPWANGEFSSFDKFIMESICLK